jgi:hypothetical protein
MEERDMTLADLTLFFQWCTIFGLAFYLLTAGVLILGRDFLFGFHKKLFSMSRETFNVAIYSYLGFFKILLTLFVIVPYLALLVISPN